MSFTIFFRFFKMAEKLISWHWLQANNPFFIDSRHLKLMDLIDKKFMYIVKKYWRLEMNFTIFCRFLKTDQLRSNFFLSFFHEKNQLINHKSIKVPTEFDSNKLTLSTQKKKTERGERSRPMRPMMEHFGLTKPSHWWTITAGKISSWSW